MLIPNNKSLPILVLFMAATLLSSTSWGARYLLQLKSPEAYRSVKQRSLQEAQRGLGFLGTAARAQDYLDHLDMMVIESTDRMSLDQLSQHPDVLAIEEEKFFAIPEPIWSSPLDWALEGYRQDLTWGLQAINAQQAWETTRGEGVRVMILDSGIDQSHPDLAARLEKVRSFMGANANDQVGHGTHVAGTIVADGSESGLLGVAPDAKFLMGKVCDTSCSSVGITQGVNWAIEERVGVVNMSLGGPFMFETQVYQRAEDANVVIVAASGNGGTGNLSYPAALPSTLAVGAVNPDLTKAPFSQWGRLLDVVAPGVNVYSTVPMGTGRASLVKIDLGQGLNEVASAGFQNSNPGDGATLGNFTFAGLGRPQDFTNVKMNGRIALIQRGEITFQEKVQAAQSNGAIGVVIFNNEPGLINGGLENPTTLPVMMIEQSAGQSILALIEQGQEVRAELSIAQTNYAAFSGTSMASPHAAGVVALIRATNPQLDARQVKALIRDTATPLTPNENNQLGRGMINAAEAVLRAKQ